MRKVLIPAFLMILAMIGTAFAAVETVTVKRDQTPLYRINPVDPTNAQSMCRVHRGQELQVARREGGVIFVRVPEQIHSFTGVCYPEFEYYIRRNDIVNGGLHPGNYRQTVFTEGRWGDDVPVFRNRNAYFNARRSMDRNGHYNAQLSALVCKLPVGTKVRSKPFRNWGVSEVDSELCTGWTDRATIK